MRKRLFSILFVVGMANIMSGCASKVDLTEQETELVASYLSSIVLKYNQYENDNKLVKLENEEEATLMPVQSVSSQVTEEKQPDERKRTPVPKLPEGIEADGEVTNSEKVSLESLYGLNNNVSLTYKNVKEYKEYPRRNADYAVAASKDCKFLAVAFELKNQGNKDVSINLLDKKASFSLKTEDGMWISAAHTLFDNDMTYFVGELKAKKTKEVVVLFEVKEAVKATNATFYAVTNNKKAYELTIK